MQAASCVDATQGFAGNLTIFNSSFVGNGLALNSLSAVNVPPVAVSCSGGTNPVSCSIAVTDSLFDSNYAQEALGMGVTCSASSAQQCNFAFTRTSFTRHLLLGPGRTYTPPNPNNFPLQIPFVQTTASALVVKAGSTSSFTLQVASCTFADNAGAALWIVQERDSSTVNGQLLADISILHSSFTNHTSLPGGMHAVSVFGARVVSLIDSRWLGNSMGALAFEVIQDSLTFDSVSLQDNIANIMTMDTVDIVMMDLAPSTLTVVNSLFTNNTGFSTFAPGPVSAFSSPNSAGMLSVGGLNGRGVISISISSSQFTSNNGYFSIGAIAVYTALEVKLTNVEADSNIGGALYMSYVTTVVVTDSRFSGNQGLFGTYGRSGTSSPGGAAITQVNGYSTIVSNCWFEENDAVSSGAALIISGIANLNITACTFKANRAWTGHGGAVAVSGTNQV